MLEWRCAATSIKNGQRWTVELYHSCLNFVKYSICTNARTNVTLIVVLLIIRSRTRNNDIFHKLKTVNKILCISLVEHFNNRMFSTILIEMRSTTQKYLTFGVVIISIALKFAFRSGNYPDPNQLLLMMNRSAKRVIHPGNQSHEFKLHIYLQSIKINQK